MTEDDKPRNGNGQFAPYKGPEASGSALREVMSAPVKRNGSFCYPPQFYSADGLIDFVENSYIQDSTIDNIRYAYNDFVRKEVEQQTRYWWVMFQQSKEADEILKDTRGSEEFQARMNDRYDEHRREVAAGQLFRLDARQTRNVAVAAQLKAQSSHFSPEEREKVLNYVFSANKRGEPLTVQACIDDLDSDSWIGDALTTSDLRAARESERVWELMNGRRIWYRYGGEAGPADGL